MNPSTKQSSQVVLVAKNPPANCRRCERCGFHPWVRKTPWRRKWQPTSVSLPGKSHGQRRLAGYSPWGRKRVRHDAATKQQQQNSFKTDLRKRQSEKVKRTARVKHKGKGYVRAESKQQLQRISVYSGKLVKVQRATQCMKIGSSEEMVRCELL